MTNLSYNRDTDGSLVLGWNKFEFNSDGSRVFDFARYELWRRTGAGQSAFLAFIDSDELQNLPVTYRDLGTSPSQQYAYKVRAIDMDRNVGTFSPELVVPPNAAPTVAITYPHANDAFSAGANIPITADATDSDGTVTQVCFYAGATLLQTLTSPPYSATWTAVHAGSYDLTALGWDNFGAAGTSPVVHISVVSQSHWVSTPSTPTGQDAAATNQNTTFGTGGAVCNQGHSVQYQLDWADGTTSSWSAAATAAHAWNSANTYAVRAQARCAMSTDVISSWSAPKYITVTNAIAPASVLQRATLYYDCNQTTGSQVLDSKGTNTGTLDNGNVFFNYSTDLGRYCLKKEDDNQAGITPTARPVNNPTFTVSCWAKPPPENDAASGTFFYIGGWPEKSYRLFTDHIHYQYSDGDTYPQRYGYCSATGGWHHYVWVNRDNGDGTANFRMFVDGFKLYDGVLSASEYNSTVAVSQKFLVQRPWSAFYYQFIGEVCNIAVFDGTALSDNEVARLSIETALQESLQIQVSPSGQLHTVILGAPGRGLTLQGSTDLSHWTALATLTNQTGTLDFTAPTSTGTNAYFYRTVVFSLPSSSRRSKR